MEKVKCVICGREYDPKERQNKDTCSTECGLKKTAIWSWYINKYKSEIMARAIEEYKKQHEDLEG